VTTRFISIALVVIGMAAPVAAQQVPSRFDRPVVLVGGHYGSPDRASASAGVLIAPPRPLASGTAPDSSRAGILVKGTAGSGGFSFGAGGSALALEGPYLTTGFDALFTVTRTGKTPRDAGADSTYVGVEGGLVLMSVRLSAGVAHRVAGPPGPKATIFTWRAGVQLPLGW
jgi:hypothetical protein